jgi:hypothetical protein
MNCIRTPYERDLGRRTAKREWKFFGNYLANLTAAGSITAFIPVWKQAFRGD